MGYCRCKYPKNKVIIQQTTIWNEIFVIQNLGEYVLLPVMPAILGVPGVVLDAPVLSVRRTAYPM